jgi:pimeloyl-ACP methyl ester carboxylesterase
MVPEPPGRRFDVGGHHLHLLCAGSGTPAVILDAALGASSLSWSRVLPGIARITRVCAYDRAGMGWSDAGPLPRTAARLAAELRELLRVGDVPPPFILVGHSFGGLVTRLFAARHSDETAGLVLLEPAHPEHWAEPSEADRRLIERGTRLCHHGVVAARLGIARIVSVLVGLGALAPARALVAVASRGGLGREDEGILAPMWKLPPEARRALRQIWTEPRFFEALGSQIESICASAAEVDAATRAGHGDLPLVTISSATASQTRLRHDAGLAQRSSRGRHVLSPASGHWIPLDDPDIVIETVREMVEAARAASSSPCDVHHDSASAARQSATGR